MANENVEYESCDKFELEPDRQVPVTTDDSSGAERQVLIKTGLEVERRICFDT